MTKCIVLGSQDEPQKEKKPIEFTKCLMDNISICDVETDSCCFYTIELICKNYAMGFDLMFAYKSNRNDGSLYLGHWNDGVVE